MSKVKDPVEKKRLSYEKDHYCKGGESHKAWRKAKPRKKAKARRRFRKAANDLMRTVATEENAPVAAVRKLEGLRPRKVVDWGVSDLRTLVASRLKHRTETWSAKKFRNVSNADREALTNVTVKRLKKLIPHMEPNAQEGAMARIAGLEEALENVSRCDSSQEDYQEILRKWEAARQVKMKKEKDRQALIQQKRDRKTWSKAV